MRILVLRFSAMGDVALTVPAIRKVLKHNERLEIDFLSKPVFAPFFNDMDRFEYLTVDFNRYKGIFGLWRLSQEIQKLKSYEYIIDLHSNLRSKLLCFFWKCSKIPYFRIDKGKADKNKAIKKTNKCLVPLPSTLNRYLKVFADAQLDIGDGFFENEGSATSKYLTNASWEGIKPSFHQKVSDFKIKFAINSKLVGWAPFAGYRLKEMPIQKQASLVFDLLNSCPDISIVLFAGRNQKEELNSFYLRFEDGMNERKKNLYFSGDITNNLEEELSLIRELSLMVSMDSANMHLAALVGIPVVGLFGTTHPYLGFIPYLQGESGTYGVKDLVCRPCTVFGKGTCYRGDFACMENLDSETVLSKIKDRLSY